MPGGQIDTERTGERVPEPLILVQLGKRTSKPLGTMSLSSQTKHYNKAPWNAVLWPCFSQGQSETAWALVTSTPPSPALSLRKSKTVMQAAPVPQAEEAPGPQREHCPARGQLGLPSVAVIEKG